MIRPKQSDIGRQVVYQGGHPDDKDEGVITSFNNAFVFVRYRGKIHSQATNPRDLTFTHPMPEDELDATAGEGEYT